MTNTIIVKAAANPENPTAWRVFRSGGADALDTEIGTVYAGTVRDCWPLSPSVDVDQNQLEMLVRARFPNASRIRFAF